MTSLEICSIEPFLYQAAPIDAAPPMDPYGGVGAQPAFGSMSAPKASASSEQINNQSIEGYLNRLREALCADMTALDARIWTPNTYLNPSVGRVEIDFPNVVSNGTATIDTTITGLVLGTHIISWAPKTVATSMDDLIVTWMIVAPDTLRTILQNPTGGAINPDPITFEFVTATVNPAA